MSSIDASSQLGTRSFMRRLHAQWYRRTRHRWGGTVLNYLQSHTQESNSVQHHPTYRIRSQCIRSKRKDYYAVKGSNNDCNIGSSIFCQEARTRRYKWHRELSATWLCDSLIGILESVDYLIESLTTRPVWLVVWQFTAFNWEWTFDLSFKTNPKITH